MANKMEGYNLGVRKGAWTKEEDDLLRQCIENHGEGNWHQVPYKAGRTGNDVKNYWNTRLRTDSRLKKVKDKPQETIKTIVIRPQPRRFIKSSNCLSSKEPILDHIQTVENCSTPSQTSPSTKNGNDWWETFLGDEDAFERATCYGLALEEEGFTSFWVDDMPQSKRQCTNVQKD
ncbi:hypothetical protein ACE6H2_011210 [Prunus campanulata]